MIAVCQLDIAIVHEKDFADDVKFTSSTALKSKHPFNCVYVPDTFEILK